MDKEKQLPRHPMQPLVFGSKGVIRFRPNEILVDLFHSGQLDLNTLGIVYGDAEYDNARQQIAQLLGYSVDGYCDLPYVSKRSKRKALKQAAYMIEQSKQEKNK